MLWCDAERLDRCSSSSRPSRGWCWDGGGGVDDFRRFIGDACPFWTSASSLVSLFRLAVGSSPSSSDALRSPLGSFGEPESPRAWGVCDADWSRWSLSLELLSSWLFLSAFFFSCALCFATAFSKYSLQYFLIFCCCFSEIWRMSSTLPCLKSESTSFVATYTV